MSQTYPYTKASVNSDKLTMEIEADVTIVKTLENIKWTSPDTLSITFDLALETAEETALDTLVTNHDGNPPTEYNYFCYCCGLNYSENALSTPTQCQCCSSTDIQDQYHKSNLIATTSPTVDDDITEGYCVGSKWINVTLDLTFTAVDVTEGAAFWKLTSDKRTVLISWSSMKDTNLEVNTGTHRIPIVFAGTPSSITIKSIRAMVGTVPTGASIIADIHKNGTTIFTTQGNRPTIAASANDSGEVTNMDIITLAKGDYLTMDIDQIGSTIAGKDLVLILELEVTPQ